MASVRLPERAQRLHRLVETAPPFVEVEADRVVVESRRSRPTPTITRPPDSRSSAAIALASATGPRTTGSATVVASVMDPDEPVTAASAVGPSSHGMSNTRWSLAASVANPSPAARRA